MLTLRIGGGETGTTEPEWKYIFPPYMSSSPFTLHIPADNWKGGKNVPFCGPIRHVIQDNDGMLGSLY